MLAILQARLSSSRLPGKVLLPIQGRPMLARQIERLSRSKTIGRLVVATSDHPEDYRIAALCDEIGIDCFRGSLDDVLDRVYSAARPYAPSHVVRLTADCPLADPCVIDRIVREATNEGVDYASNTLIPTWPDGLDAEIVRFEVLETAWREAILPSEREHVTPFVYNHPERFSLINVTNDHDLSGLRWCVDEPQDLEFVRQVYDALFPIDPAFTTGDILALLEKRPELKEINSGTKRNEGFKKSLEKDKQQQVSKLMGKTQGS